MENWLFSPQFLCVSFMSGENLLCDLALVYTLDVRPTLSDSEQGEIRSLVTRYASGTLTHEAAAKLYEEKFNSSTAIEKLREILEVSDDPLPPRSDSPDEGLRRKTQPWSPPEDTRLLAAIHRFGRENWTAIAQFVGNGRTRSQCSQRWQRGLDPRISRSPWTAHEESSLRRLVALHGEKSWIRVSLEMGNRSDVQCRYRYMQIQKGRSPLDESEDEGEEASPAVPPLPAVVEVKTPVKKERPQQSGWNDWLGSERIELDLGQQSTSEIFWLLHL
jgi:hypothetical protein